MLNKFDITEKCSLLLDGNDPLKHFRDRFYIPDGKIYMDGDPPWFTLAEEIGRKQASLVGAEENEVIVHSSNTVNLHSLISTFFKPDGNRTKILIDELNFPSDRYAVDSQLLNMEYLTAEAHKRGIIIGFDCCHSYHEIWQVVQHVQEIMDHREYEAFPRERGTVS